MWRPRIIPCLLLKNKGLVKTVRFKDPTYIGDPINAVKIFNDKQADELVFLDITATSENRTISLDLVRKLSDECFMPFAVGGGFNKIGQIKNAFKFGAEKVCINSAAITNTDLIKEASKIFGNQSIIACMDVKKNLFGKYQVHTHAGTKNTKLDPVQIALELEKAGAGEIFLNSVDKDGTMQGYDIELIKRVAQKVNVPLIACGGAGTLTHFVDAVKLGKASAVAAGSMFVFHGRRRAVLITYPTNEEIRAIRWNV